MATIAFDIYGTLIDPHGVVTSLEGRIGRVAREFSVTWREKQLEYSFRRGLMGRYEDFETCTRQALTFTCTRHGVSLTDDQSDELMALYGKLPTFPDVREGLERLSRIGFRLFAFSNGSASTIDGLLSHAGIRSYMEGLVSANDIRTFKPNPEVYTYFNSRTDSAAAQTWLVSSNPFDIIGAMAAGWKGAWVQRTKESVFDPWGVEPTVVAETLSELHTIIREHP